MKRALVVAGSVLFAGLMVGVIAPVTMRLAAPIACPRGYVDTAVVAETSTDSEGASVMSGSLYCIDREGVLVHANPLVAFVGLGLEMGAALGALALVARVRAALRQRGL